MATRDTPNRPVKAVITAFEIVEAINEMDGAGVVELAERLDLAQSTVHSHLSTLTSLEYLVKKNGEYRLGLKLLHHGIQARDTVGFYDTAKSEMEALGETVEGSIWLYTEEYGRGVVIGQVNRNQGLGLDIARIGWQTHLHCTAAGKAMLAHMSQDYRDEVLDTHGLPKQTPATITDREALSAELAEVRDRGYATNEEEHDEGIAAFGAPIVVDDEVLGAISVSGPSHRMEQPEVKDAIVSELLDATNQLELKLRFR